MTVKRICRVIVKLNFFICYLTVQQYMIHRKAIPILSEYTENSSSHHSVIEEDEQDDHPKIENSCRATGRL